MDKPLIYLIYSYLILIIAGSASLPVYASHPPCSKDILAANTTGACYVTAFRADLHWFQNTTGQHMRGAKPVLYLIGGPGLNVDLHRNRLERLAELLQRPIFMLGDYGTALSDIRDFDCDIPSVGQRFNTRDSVKPYDMPNAQKKMRTCMQKVKGNFPDALINSSPAEKAHQIVYIRTMLGIRSWDVIAESFGYYTYQELARIDSDHLGTVIFDSPDIISDTPEHSHAAALISALKRFMRYCRSARTCPLRRQRTIEAFERILKPSFLATMRPIEVRDSVTSDVIGYVHPSAEILTLSTVSSLKKIHNPFGLPYVFTAKTPNPFARRATILFRRPVETLNAVATGAHFLMKCHVIKQTGQGQMHQKTDFAAYDRYLSSLFGAACDSHAASAYVQPSSHKKPAYVLAGDLDPLIDIDLIRQRFGPSVIEYKQTGHIASMKHPCVITDIKTILDNPEQAVRSSCKAKDLKINYYQPVVKRGY